MALGPREAQGLTMEQTASAEEIERAMDAQLVRSFVPTDEACTLMFDDLEPWPDSKVQAELERRYVAAGWSRCEFIEDGDQFAFVVIR